MPTKHIDAAQWSAIESLTVELTKQTNTSVKEGDVLKEVIAAGLNFMSVKGLSDRFTYQPKYNALIMCRQPQGKTVSTNVVVPSVSTTIALLDGSEGFMVCVYGITASGRSSYAQALHDKLNAVRGQTVSLYDDADAAAISQAWADYVEGKGVIIVIHASGQTQALDRLYSTHRRIQIEDATEFAFGERIQKE